MKLLDGEKEEGQEAAAVQVRSGHGDGEGKVIAVKTKRVRGKGKREEGKAEEVEGEDDGKGKRAVKSRKERWEEERPGWRRCKNVIACKPPDKFDFVEPPSSYVRGKWMVLKD